jgi:hypothetical protein
MSYPRHLLLTEKDSFSEFARSPGTRGRAGTWSEPPPASGPHLRQRKQVAGSPALVPRHYAANASVPLLRRHGASRAHQQSLPQPPSPLAAGARRHGNPTLPAKGAEHPTRLPHWPGQRGCPVGWTNRKWEFGGRGRRRKGRKADARFAHAKEGLRRPWGGWEPMKLLPKISCSGLGGGSRLRCPRWAWIGSFPVSVTMPFPVVLSF